MTKPWEEKWGEHSQDGTADGIAGWVAGAGGQGAIVLTVFGAKERVRLAAAAPEMARALRDGFEVFEAFGDEECDHEANICWCSHRAALAEMRAALKKAGVLP